MTAFDKFWVYCAVVLLLGQGCGGESAPSDLGTPSDPGEPRSQPVAPVTAAPVAITVAPATNDEPPPQPSQRPGEVRIPGHIVRGFADRLAAVAGVGGYDLDRSVNPGSGYLASGEHRIHSLRLIGRTPYSIVGMCHDCDDIDLRLYDENNNLIDSDTLDDAVPIVVVTPAWSGSFTVRVSMYTCPDRGCYYVFAIYSGSRLPSSDGNQPPGGSGTPGAPSSQTPSESESRAIIEQLAAGAVAFSEDGYELTTGFDIETGYLGSGEEMTHDLVLPAGASYKILGACSGCEDIDMFLHDDEGNLIDSDELGDAIPIVDAPAGGGVTVVVRMYDCPAERCYYGFAVHSRPVTRQGI